MTNSILLPKADEQIAGWAAYFATLDMNLLTTTLYKAIYETSPDDDASFIYTVAPVAEKTPTYTCALDDITHDVIKAGASITAKGPTTATPGSRFFSLCHPDCHSDLTIKVSSDAAGADEWISKSVSLPANKYSTIEFAVPVPAGYRGPVFMHFTPKLSGTGTRYCRVSQAQLAVYETVTDLV